MSEDHLANARRFLLRELNARVHVTHYCPTDLSDGPCAMCDMFGSRHEQRQGRLEWIDRFDAELSRRYKAA